jgi:hypothetical protein
MKASDGTPKKGADKSRKKKPPTKKRTRAKPVSLHPMSFDEALSALLHSKPISRR